MGVPHHHHRLRLRIRRHFNKNNNYSLILLTLASFTFLLVCTSAYSIPATGEVVVEEEGKSLHIGGPGSIPPTCRSKCGKCYPCKPVHVPIHPGLAVPLEYYPEAWRCLCRMKLFMP